MLFRPDIEKADAAEHAHRRSRAGDDEEMRSLDNSRDYGVLMAEYALAGFFRPQLNVATAPNV
ncbi:hypothetical protein AO260_16460 [Pseudomonas sp. ABAC21]|nr:hypothetical protein AO260_16460 [Pseudomonas sp. ABAC21]